MEEKTSNKNNRILLIALTALLFLLIGYTFYMSKDHKEAVKYLQDEKGEYLFNVKNDPSEKMDLKTREPGIFAQLKNKMTVWESTVLAPVPLSKPD